MPQQQAPEMDQAQFKKGCELGGGHYIENPDGSFQCNTKGGITIWCKDTKSQCQIKAKVGPGAGIEVDVTKKGYKTIMDSAIWAKPVVDTGAVGGNPTVAGPR